MNLFDIPVVQVAISVIISWALFAIFISLIQEAFAQILAERGRFMKNYLIKQLKDQANGINWALLLYQHGSIEMLVRENNKPTNDIAPNLFATALIDVIGNSNVVQSQKVPNEYSNPMLSNFKSAMKSLQQSEIISFLHLSMMNAELNRSAADGSINEGLVYDRLVMQIENWYKELLERLSLWYKKRMRQKLFIFGFITAVLLNVDSIQLFNFYKIHPEARTAVERYYHNYPQDSSLSKLTDKDILIKNVTSLDSLVEVADLPIGFDYNLFRSHSDTKGWVWWKLIGLLISGFAASLGAPFWFDLLKKAYSTTNK